MNKRKPIDVKGLNRFWKKAEAWISTNIQALFDNDDELEARLGKLEVEIQELNNTVIPYDAQIVAEDEYTEDDVLSVITPETDDEEETEDYWESVEE